MSVSSVLQLDQFGPVRCDRMPEAHARRWCRQIVSRRYENFSVLSRLVPPDRRDDFAAVYAFCRWADDLGDETGSTDEALELLKWWRDELGLCFDGSPRHPVFVALAPSVARHTLPQELFDQLIQAFEQDQRIRRYATWEQLLGYCRLSANPVGRLVLMMLEPDPGETAFERSDEICTALQLTNHWQDIGRDIVERDRIYVPAEMIDIEAFEERLAGSARQGHAVDREFLGQSRTLVRRLVERTWPFYESGSGLLECVGAKTRPIVWLLASGGMRVLRLIEQWNFETVLHRPHLTGLNKLALLIQAHFRARSGSLDHAGKS